ncbi:hypothetical protein JI721_03025 [Alicyclobacillus cycloheptanicus]|uniref:TrbL/VirB6 plasmid conjugal transfer protein n=1 Tax=Alicyclobacillus cycloheptanicus TaxID=1457 RepID=A0ABT9XK28_9BACL|nr:conjugal transfer protein TrbL family protein [Alicyclobacillus cycloheptanicus]MCL6453725.1 hypothetical protein [Alicyclobacillus sp.]MDQ0190635.1 hypothetical protein [Alicyclobacillus cycloheptanicus]WDM01834.1 hypothetical protein JI721_03025 [Alicyclobacillus cycloheptanicus]
MGNVAGNLMWRGLGYLLQHMAQSLFGTPLHDMIKLITTVGGLKDYFSAPWLVYLIHLSQAFAGTLLGLTLAWQAYHLYIMRTTGDGGNPTDLLVKVMYGAVGIVVYPWAARYMIPVANGLADVVASAPFGSSLPNMSTNLQGTLSTAMQAQADMFLVPLLLLIGLVLLIVIFIQSMIRTVELIVIGVIGPVFSVGWLGNGGIAMSFWRELITLGMSQVVQVMMLWITSALVASPAQSIGHAIITPFMLIASLWVTYKTPSLLRQWTYHTGVGQAAGAGASTAIHVALMRAKW